MKLIRLIAISISTVVLFGAVSCNSCCSNQNKAIEATEIENCTECDSTACTECDSTACTECDSTECAACDSACNDCQSAK